MKPETEIRNLKRELKCESASYRALKNEARDWQARALKAEIELTEWKARFDVLLRREEPKP